MISVATPKGDLAAQSNRHIDSGKPPLLFLAWTLAYAATAWFTRAYFMADTVDYVSAVTLHDRGIDYVFWDFRHLSWRPLGWVFLHILNPVMPSTAHEEPRIGVLYIFIALNCIGGLLSVFLLRAFLRRFSVRAWAIECSAFAFLFSFAFLNYIHGGTPYIPGLMFTILGYYLVARSAEPDASWYWKYAAALSLALAVCLWFPYSFAVPGALALPFFFPNRGMQHWRTISVTTIACVLLGIFTYGAVLVHLHLYTVPAIMQWVGQGASSVAGVHGLDRTVFGFAHSYIEMGKDGVLFKRYILHDPYNPVSIRQLPRVSLWKLALFYTLLAAIVLTLVRSAPGRNILAMCVLAAGPVLVFSFFWFGGDIERYLPLYPAFFLALSSAIGGDRSKLVRLLATVFLILALVSNVGALSRHKLEDQEQATVDRIEPLLPLLQPASRVVEVDIHDDLVNFSRSFPLNPVNRKSKLLNYPLLNPGTPQTQRWRQAFAANVATTWNAHADVWISKRLLSSRPKADWDWIEHSDPNVKWKDLYEFFSQFDFGSDVDGEDGFVQLPPTQKNAAIIDSLQATSRRRSGVSASKRLSSHDLWDGR